ncbi:conserved Plasmodium protein, unknown function [Plasmodium vivax]|nr:conserved Plasmodium protein, unknown function [Plasmodium vivax]
MHPANKEEGNQAPAAKLDFPDSASDDQISVDQENVWDADLNIADDDLLVLGDGGKGEAEAKPPGGSSSGDAPMEGHTEERREDLTGGHPVGGEECQIGDPPEGRKQGGASNCAEEESQTKQTPNTGEQLNDKGSPNVNMHYDEQFVGNSGKGTNAEEPLSPPPHESNAAEEECPPDRTNQNCTNYAVQMDMLKMDPFFDEKGENRLNSAGDENVGGNLQKGSDKSDLLPHQTTPLNGSMEKSGGASQLGEEQPDVATQDGGPIRAEVDTTTQLKRQCEILKKKLKEYEKKNLQETVEKKKMLEKLQTYERNCNHISSKCDEYEKKVQQLRLQMEQNKNENKRREEEMKENMTKAGEELSRKELTIQEMKNLMEEYKREINESEHSLMQKEEAKRKDQLMHKKEVQNLEQKITQLEKQLGNKEEEISQLKNRNKQLNEEYTFLKMKEEKNEQNICNLKSNLQMNEKESFVKYEMIQEQNNQIEQLLMENKKNVKGIELLKNEKNKVESENEILKKDLLYVQEKLKGIEKHSYDIYEMKNYVESVIEKNKSLMEQLEMEKNQKEELKGKIKFFLTEMNNSAICLKAYKMKCSFFVDALRKCEERMGLLRRKLKGYESGQSFHARWGAHPALGVALGGGAADPAENLGDNRAENLGDKRVDNPGDYRSDNPGDFHQSRVKQTILLREELQMEIKKAEEVAEKMLKLQNTVKDKNLLINEKNYKLNKYKLLNQNLKKAIVGYQNSMKAMKENIHNLEKQIEMKEVKSITVPPKVTVHVSKLASFENNLKNELKGLIGNSSTFLESTFKYINENPLKKNLQNKAFFLSAAEKKSDDGERGRAPKEAPASTSTVSNAEGAVPNLANTSIGISGIGINGIGTGSSGSIGTAIPGDGSLADVTGFAKNFIYTNMNRIPNFISDQNGKNSSAQLGAAARSESPNRSGDAVVRKNDGAAVEGNHTGAKQVEANQVEASRRADRQVEPNQAERPKPDAKPEGNNRYIDLFMGKKNLNKVSSTSDILNVQHVSQFYANTENKIKDLFDMNKKKDSPKIKEKEESQKGFHSSENAFFPMHIFGGSKPKEGLPARPGDAKNEGELGCSPPSTENSNKYDLAGCKKKSLNSLYYDNNAAAEGNTKEAKETDKRPEKVQPSSSDEDAQINDDVWNEKIDLENFEEEEL